MGDRRKRIYAGAERRGELSSAEAPSGRRRRDAYHHCKRAAGARTASVLPACRESSGDFERRRGGTACADERSQRRRGGGADRESAPAFRGHRLRVRIAAGRKRERQGARGVDQHGGNGGGRRGGIYLG